MQDRGKLGKFEFDAMPKLIEYHHLLWIIHKL